MKKITREIGTATYQDVLDAPENMVAEIICGVLHTHLWPAPSHLVAGSALGARIHLTFHGGGDGPGGWWILDEPEVHLGTDVRVPNIAGWRRERLPEVPATAYFETAPDWVCEILSPSTRAYDVTDKREIYGTYGVTHIWFVDPDARRLEAFENHNGGWRLISVLRGDDPVSVAPFDAISFGLDELWS